MQLRLDAALKDKDNAIKDKEDAIKDKKDAIRRLQQVYPLYDIIIIIIILDANSSQSFTGKSLFTVAIDYSHLGIRQTEGSVYRVI